MKASGATRFYREDGAVFDLRAGAYVARPVDPRNATLTVLRRGGAPVLANDGAEAWDLGDGVLGLTFKTKANSIDPDAIAMLHDAAAKAEESFRALIIVNQGEHFCVGANLCFACDAVQAAAETYSGLVEVGVGLIPGGAGTMNMLWRALEGVPEGTQVNVLETVTQVFKNIALAKVATSADEAKAIGYFRGGDGVTFDRARQLAHTKARALGLAESGYHPPVPRAYRLPGESGIATLSMMVDTLVAGGFASAHDATIARKLAGVLCGGAGGAAREVTEAEMLELEGDVFVSLCGEPKSQERMQYMLMNNKPLRN
jgi:3-hydroxyacyl-CoA dehydrogenase